MYPVLLKIGPLVIHTYGLFVALAYLTAIFLAAKYAKRYQLKEDIIFDLGFWILVSSLVGARILEVITNFDYYRLNWLKIFKIWEGGLSFWGGLIAALIVGVIFAKIKKLDVLATGDLTAPFIALGQSIGRLGCFFAGCCYGKITCSLIGVTFTSPDSLAPSGVRLHPAQLYEAVGDFLIFLILLKRERKKNFTGEVFALYFILYGLVRLIVEFFRGDNKIVFLNLTLYQIISVVAIVLGLGFYLLMGIKRKDNKIRIKRITAN